MSPCTARPLSLNDANTLAAPTEVASIADIKLTAAVTNTGSSALKVVKYGTVLDSALPTRSFVVSRDGVEAAFTGVKLQVDLDQAGEDAFVVIPAGETVLVEHEGGYHSSVTHGAER